MASRVSTPGTRLNPIGPVIQPWKGLPRMRTPKRRTISPVNAPTSSPSRLTWATTGSARWVRTTYSSHSRVWKTLRTRSASIVGSIPSRGTRSSVNTGVRAYVTGAPPEPDRATRALGPYSHSMVPGGFDVMSSVTRFT